MRKLFGVLTVTSFLCLTVPVTHGTVRREEGITTQKAVSAKGLYRFLTDLRTGLDAEQKRAIAELVHEECGLFDCDPLLILALIDVESGFSPRARGPQGARGLTQILPSTGQAVARRFKLPWRGAESLHHPVLSVQLAIRYLSGLEKQFGDPLLAVAAYNMGPGRVERMSPARARNSRYVRRVMSRYEAFRSRYHRGT